MYPSTYYVEKTGGSIGDVLLAYGVTAWLSDLLPTGLGIDVSLVDQGSAYGIRLEGIDGIREEWLQERRRPAPLLRYLVTPKTVDDCPPGVPTFDYDQARARQSAYWKAYRDLTGPHDSRRQALREQGIDAPDSELPVWLLINTQKARGSYNKLIATWSQHGAAYSDLVRIGLDLFGTFPNSIEAAEAAWKELAAQAGLDGSQQETAVQIINPELAKGGNQSKAQKLVESNVKGFWLLEYLRYVGLFHAGMPIVVQGSGDRKTYVPLPRQMQWSTTAPLLGDYRGALWASTAIKSDIRAVLSYMTVYLEDWRRGHADQAGFMPLAFSQPRDHTQGIAVVFYKDMGAAHAVLDMGVLRLPRWMADPTSLEEADAYLALIEEHRRVVDALDEARGDEYELLRLYRRFLTTAELRTFLELCAGLGRQFMSLLNRGDSRERGRASGMLFSVSTLERMIAMQEGPKAYYSIFQNEGFQRVAAAIRQATFLPQWNKSKNRQTEYQPEYGLGQKLRQKAPYPEEFLAELAAFVHRYQAETLRKMEHPTGGQPGVPRRTVLTAEDLADVALLVDDYGSEVVAELLVAAGYCWAERRESSRGGATDDDAASQDERDPEQSIF